MARPPFGFTESPDLFAVPVLIPTPTAERMCAQLDARSQSLDSRAWRATTHMPKPTGKNAGNNRGPAPESRRSTSGGPRSDASKRGDRSASSSRERTNARGTREDKGGRAASDRTGARGDNDRRSAQDRSRAHGRPDRKGSPKLSTLLREFQEMQATLQKRDDATERERVLQEDNFRLRKRNARLLDELEVGGGLEEGMVAVSQDDADELAAFRELVESSDDLSTLLEEHGELQEARQQSDAVGVLSEAADVLDIPNVNAFVKLMQQQRMHVEISTRRVPDPDDPRKRISEDVVLVRSRDDENGQLVDAYDWLEDNQREFIPALLAEPEDDANSNGDDSDDDTGGVRTSRSLRTRGESTRNSTTHEASSDATNGDGGGRRSLRDRGTRDRGAQSDGSGIGVSLPAMRGDRQPKGGRVESNAAIDQKKKASGRVSYSI